MPYAERNSEFHLVGFTELVGGVSYGCRPLWEEKNKRVDEVQEK